MRTATPISSAPRRASLALAVTTILAACAAQAAAVAAQDPPGAPLHEIVVTGKKLQLKSLFQKSIFDSAFGDKALDRQQLKSAGPVGGAAQALSFAPGVSVNGYGQTGATKASISVNGLKQGWGGFSGGTIDDGSVAVSFDGVPMVNAATGLWETPELPQTGILQGARVSYGPGNPENRWYNNIGGGINFVPIQPSATAGGNVALTYGSFSTENAVFSLQTGRIDGWETVLAGGAGKANNFRTSPDGYAWPSKNFAGFIKTRKQFGASDVSFGAYIGDGHGSRPTPIPLTPVAGISINGQDANGNPNPGPLFSQASTGYYSAINENVWQKNDFNRMWMIYARQNIQIDSRVVMHNQTWYRRGDRLHVHYNNYTAGANNLYEHNNPFSHMFGDKLWSDVYLPYNTIGVGGYLIDTVYNSRNAFFSTQPPYNGSYLVPNAKFRSDYWYMTNLAAFVQDRISPLPGLTVTPGLREVSFHTDYYPRGNVDFAQANVLYPSHNQGQLPAATTNYDKIEPSINARWQPIRWLAVYGNWGTAYRLPQVGGGGGLYQSQQVGGDILERGLEYQAGVKANWLQVGAFQKVLLNLNYYHIHFSNQFIGVNSGNGNFLGLGTGDSVYHGFNFSAEANVGHLKLYGNLNVEKANFNQYDFQGTNYNGLPVPYVPDTTFNVGTYWHFVTDGIVIKPRAWYQYVGTQDIFSNLAGAPTTQTMASYGVLNLALAATLPNAWFGDMLKAVKAKIEVMNALDKRYNGFEDISSGGLYNTPSNGYILALPGAPRAIYGTIEVKF